jgi:AbrB family looped-hinge helix DNA binding protein
MPQYPGLAMRRVWGVTVNVKHRVRLAGFGWHKNSQEPELHFPTAGVWLFRAGVRHGRHTADYIHLIGGEPDSGQPEIRYNGIVHLVKVGSKGQVSIPKAILVRLGIRKETAMLVEATSEGAIVLRPAGVYPLEIYREGRMREFEEADRLSPAERRRLKALKR